ncbi:uncharacterized protein [Hemitrygon akajei]|uniref:uncharacterized protein n=1 Tax=Hemitrygon akajei TaxID=2704970 RepID=UPI003BFA25D2
MIERGDAKEGMRERRDDEGVREQEGKPGVEGQIRKRDCEEGVRTAALTKRVEPEPGWIKSQPGIGWLNRRSSAQRVGKVRSTRKSRQKLLATPYQAKENERCNAICHFAIQSVSILICSERFTGRKAYNWKQTTTEDEGTSTSEPARVLRASAAENPSDSEFPLIQSGESLGITSRWRFPAPGPKCKQDDDNQQSSVRYRMDRGRKSKRVGKVLKRILPGGSSREDDWDKGSNVPKQGQIESNIPECSTAAEEVEKIQPRDTDQEPGTDTGEATACQPRDSDVRDTDQDPATSTSEATACQPRDSDVRDTDQDPGTSTSEATACQPRDSDIRDTEQGPGTSTTEVTAFQPRDSDVRDTDQDSGNSTSEATACLLGSSLETEFSSPQQGADPEFTISDLLAEGEEYRLYQLTKFYRDRLKQAIEEKVERLGWMLTKEGHFSREENEKVTELTEKGKRAESSRLFLSLVMDKGSRARRVMWESFVMWRTELPKLDRILREIKELGPDPLEYIDIAQGLSELPSHLIGE